MQYDSEQYGLLTVREVMYYYLTVGRAHSARSEVRDSAWDGENV